MLFFFVMAEIKCVLDGNNSPKRLNQGIFVFFGTFFTAPSLLLILLFWMTGLSAARQARTVFHIPHICMPVTGSGGHKERAVFTSSISFSCFFGGRVANSSNASRAIRVQSAVSCVSVCSKREEIVIPSPPAIFWILSMVAFFSPRSS